MGFVPPIFQNMNKIESSAPTPCDGKTGCGRERSSMIQLISNLLGHENRICSLPGYEHCSTDIGLFLMEMIVGMVFCVSRKSNWGFPAPKKKVSWEACSRAKGDFFYLGLMIPHYRFNGNNSPTYELREPNSVGPRLNHENRSCSLMERAHRYSFFVHTPYCWGVQMVGRGFGRRRRRS